MALTEGMNDIVDDMLFSYDARIKGMGDLFETSHQVLQGFRDSLLDTKEDRKIINNELRENLAKNESLRKRDFDNMMKGILSAQDDREKELRTLLNSYINEQKEMAQILRDSLDKLRTSVSNNEVVRINDFRDMMKDILVTQDRRKAYVTSKLKEFRKEQQETAERLKKLLAKGRDLRTRDLKLMLRELNINQKERLSHRQKRQIEVKNLLGGFNKKRGEATGKWRALQEQMKQRRAVL